jgi:hypothetical protein
VTVVWNKNGPINNLEHRLYHNNTPGRLTTNLSLSLSLFPSLSAQSTPLGWLTVPLHLINSVFFRPDYEIRDHTCKKVTYKCDSLMWSVFIHCMEQSCHLSFLLLMSQNATNTTYRTPFPWEYCLTCFFVVCAETNNTVTTPSLLAELLGFPHQPLLVFSTVLSVSNLSRKLTILTLVPD